MSKSFSDIEKLNTPRVNTTVGELVEIITNIAFEAGNSEEECYQIAALAVDHILSKSNLSDNFSSQDFSIH